MDTQDVCTHPPVPLLGLTSASTCTWLVYMHVTEFYVCKCTTSYSKRFVVISTTLTCILQMIIYGFVRMHVYMHLAFKELMY